MLNKPLLSDEDAARLRLLLERHTDEVIAHLCLDVIAAGAADVYDEGAYETSELKRVVTGILDLAESEPMKIHSRRIGLVQNGQKRYLAAIESATHDVVRQVSVRSSGETFFLAADPGLAEFIGAMRVSDHSRT